MSTDAIPGVEACRHWRPSVAFGGVRIGLVPAWNAVVGLNGPAADIWDLLAEKGTVPAGLAEIYRTRQPARAATADADIAACLGEWRAQGLFDPPAARCGPAAQPAPADVAAFAFRRGLALGARSLTLEVEDRGLAAMVEDMTAAFAEARDPTRPVLRAAGPDGGWRLFLDGVPIRTARNRVEMRGALASELVRMAGDWHAMVHGAVLTRAGRAVFLAGRSGSGKSTLAAGLVAQGWQLVAEDCAPFDGAMRVAPMPFALSIKDGAVGVLEGAFPGLAAARTHVLGRRRVRYRPLPDTARAAHPVRPDLLVDLRYRPDFDAGRAETRPLTAVERLGLFLTEEGYVDFERDVGNAFLRFVEATPGIALDHGGIDAAAAAIGRHLDGGGEG